MTISWSLGRTEEKINILHEMSKILSSVAQEQDDYILSSTFAVLNPKAFNVCVMKSRIQSASGCRPDHKMS